MFASPVTNKRETPYQQALDHEMLFSLDAGICAAASKATRCRVVGVVGQVVPTRLFGERELGKATGAGIATIPGGISLKVTEPHFADPSCAIEDLTFIIYLKEKFEFS